MKKKVRSWKQVVLSAMVVFIAVISSKGSTINIVPIRVETHTTVTNEVTVNPSSALSGVGNQDVTPAAIATPQRVPTATPLPMPSIRVERGGTGGPQTELSGGLGVTNNETHTVVLYGAMWDTDRRQQKVYFQGGRLDLEGKRTGVLPLTGYIAEACFLPTIFSPRNGDGLTELSKLASAPVDNVKSLQDVLVSGNVYLVGQYPPEVCP